MSQIQPPLLEIDAFLLLQSEELQAFASWVEVAAVGTEVDDPEVISQHELQARLPAVLQAFRQERYPDADGAATASQWSMDYCCTALVPLLGFAIVGQAQVGAELHYRLRGPALKAAIVPARLRPLGDEAPEAFVVSSISGVVAAFVRALAHGGRVSERLLWTNLAVVADAVCTSLSEHSAHRQRTLQVRQALFSMQVPGHASRLGDLLREHPLPAPDLPAPWLVRRICCLHYRLNEPAPLCTSCPLLLRKPVQEQAAYLRSELC